MEELAKLVLSLTKEKQNGSLNLVMTVERVGDLKDFRAIAKHLTEDAEGLQTLALMGAICDYSKTLIKDKNSVTDLGQRKPKRAAARSKSI